LDAKKFLISGILGGIVIWIISFIFDYLVVMAFPYNILELGGMRAIDDPLMLLFFLSPFVTAFAMSFVYPYLNLKGNFMQKGQKFGFLVWLVAGVPSAFIVYTSMTYPIGFTISSFIGSLLYMIGGAIAIAKFME